MRNIEELAEEYCNKERTTRSEHAAFVAGYQKAHEWISIEDDLPDRYIPINIKISFVGEDGFAVTSGELISIGFVFDNEKNTDLLRDRKIIVIHWKYID